MEPFKERIDADAVRRLAAELAAAHDGFAAKAFVAGASAGLEELELKARVRHVARVLRAHLPADFERALEALLAAMGPPLETTDRVTDAFRYWPVLQVVEDFGLDTPRASLAALHEMTRRFSAEFAIRPFLRHHPAITWSALEGWAADPDVHVRRLCSEGTRPRLPWGGVLRASVVDPSRGLALIDRLVDDEALYVRRSVANHLNDVSKDHPDRAVDTARAWLEEPSGARTWAARHGLRTLFRKGHGPTLALFGFRPVPLRVGHLHVTPRVHYPGTAVLEVDLAHDETEDVPLRVEWVVEAPRWRKVFRGPERQVAPGETWSIRKRFGLKPVSIRTNAPGAHRIGIQVNGEETASVRFTLVGGD